MQRLSRKVWGWVIASALFFGSMGYLYSTGAFGDGSVLLASLEGDVTPIHIAVVIPEKQDDTYPEVENVGKLFAQKINANGGVNGHPIQVDFYFDGNDKVDEAQAQALKIVEEGRALVVIGHRNSAASEAVAPIYEEAGIPTLNSGASAPGVTKDHPWAFRVINNTNDLGKYAALYAYDVLGYETASVIHLTDDFGTSLAESFQATFEERGGMIVYEKPMERVSEVGEKEIQAAKQVVSEITSSNGEKPGLVFIAGSRNTSQQIVLALNELHKQLPMLASYSTGDTAFSKLFDDPSKVDGMYATSLLNYDVSGETAQNFYNEYTEMYPDSVPTWLGGTTYDSLLVALKALEGTHATGEARSVKNEREMIRDYLASMNNPENAVDGTRGKIFFDSQRNFPQPPTFGVFQHGDFIPAPIQLRPVASKDPATELQGNIILDGNKYIYKTNVAYTGIRINEITDVDVDKAHTFTADFYIWFRYQGDIDVGSIDFLNSVAPIKLGDPVSSSTQAGINYRLYRVRSQFHTTFDLQHYPFDTQELALEFRHHTLTREQLIYVKDVLGMDHITRGSDLLARLNSDGVFASVTDWNPSDPRIFIDVHREKASFGNPALIGNQQGVENSTFNIKMDIHRNYPRFMLKNLLPLFCLVALAYVSLFLPGYKFESIISVMTGSVLSIVFFHVNLSNRLNVGYNVALDYVFYGTYMLFIIELMIVVIAWHHHQTDEKIAHKRMVFARAIYPLYLILGGVYFLWTNIVPQGLPFAQAVMAFLAG